MTCSHCGGRMLASYDDEPGCFACGRAAPLTPAEVTYLGRLRKAEERKREPSFAMPGGKRVEL